MVTSAPEFELSLSARARLERPGEGLRIAAAGFEVRLAAPAPGVAAALGRLADGGATEDQLCVEVLAPGETSALFVLFGLLRPLDAAGLLRRRLCLAGRPFAT